MEMDRRLSLQQQMGSGGLHQVHSSPNITSPSSNNSQPHPPQPPAAPPAPPAAPPAPPGMKGFSKLQWCAIENHQDTVYVVNWHIQDVLTDVKSVVMLFFKLCANRYGFGLSNEPLFIIIAQGAAKL